MKASGDASRTGLTVVSVPAIQRRPDRLLVDCRRRDGAAPASAPIPGWQEGERSYVAWLPPKGARLIGLGATVTLTGHVDSPELRRRAAETLDSVHAMTHPALPAIRPRLIGGFAFAPRSERSEPWRTFSDGRLVLPRWTYGCSNGRAWLSLAIEGPANSKGREQALAELATLTELLEQTTEDSPSPRSAPLPEPASEPAEEWTNRVTEIAEAIDEGLVSKVVAARCTELQLKQAPDPCQALEYLVDRFPPCTGFCLELAGTAFLGATPERLVRREGNEVATVALAGSAPPGEDEALLERPKDRLEHRFVVEDVLARLEHLCREIQAGETRVVRLRNVVHLETPVRAQPRDGAGVLDIAAELHPTPAVGGAPRRRAVRWIDEREPVDRGWYSGPFGWLDASGDGEFVVALRCGVLRRDRAWLYAGAGIVRGSDPEAEWRETELKMAPMREALDTAARQGAAANASRA